MLCLCRFKSSLTSHFYILCFFIQPLVVNVIAFNFEKDVAHSAIISLEPSLFTSLMLFTIDLIEFSTKVIYFGPILFVLEYIRWCKMKIKNEFP